jgi:hypothetical protein
MLGLGYGERFPLFMDKANGFWGVYASVKSCWLDVATEALPNAGKVLVS